MSDVIRHFSGKAAPNSNWVRSSLPHKSPQLDTEDGSLLPEVKVEGVPRIPSTGTPGSGSARPLFDAKPQPPAVEYPSGRRRSSIFRDPSTYDNRT